MPKKQLISLDFTEHDTIGLLELMLSMCKENKVSGMIYAVSIKGPVRTNDVICGATGKLADNGVMAAGLASMLSVKFANDAIQASIASRE